MPVKSPDTPALEIFGRERESSISAGSGINPGEEAETSGSIIIGHIQPLMDTQTSIIHPKDNNPNLVKARNPIMFKCKICRSSSYNANELSGAIVNSKNASRYRSMSGKSQTPANEPKSILKDTSKIKEKEKPPPPPAKSAPPESKAQEEGSLKERFTMPLASAFPRGRNPCVDGKPGKSKPEKSGKNSCPTSPKPKCGFVENKSMKMGTTSQATSISKDLPIKPATIAQEKPPEKPPVILPPKNPETSDVKIETTTSALPAPQEKPKAPPKSTMQCPASKAKEKLVNPEGNKTEPKSQTEKKTVKEQCKKKNLNSSPGKESLKPSKPPKGEAPPPLMNALPSIKAASPQVKDSSSLIKDSTSEVKSQAAETLVKAADSVIKDAAPPAAPPAKELMKESLVKAADSVIKDAAPPVQPKELVKEAESVVKAADSVIKDAAPPAKPKELMKESLGKAADSVIKDAPPPVKPKEGIKEAESVVKVAIPEMNPNQPVEAKQPVMGNQSVKANQPVKAAVSKPDFKKEDLPPAPPAFSMPLYAAFPKGRNPCRDGPKGSTGKNDNPCNKPKVKSFSSSAVKDEPKPKPPEPIKDKKEPIEEKPKKKGKEPDMAYCSEPKYIQEKKEGERPCPKKSSGECPKKEEPKPAPSAGKSGDSTKGSGASSSSKKSASPPGDSTKGSGAPSPSKESATKLENKQPKKECTPICKEKGSEKCKEGNLLKFPVARLDETLKQYAASIAPLLTPEELKKEMELIKEFEDNEGNDLQELLMDEAANSCNWLTHRWTNAAYLSYQAPLTVFSSPALAFPQQKFDQCIDYLTFIAKAIHAIVEFKGMVEKNEIPVSQMGSKDLDNSQYCKIFGTVRKPKRFCDQIKQFTDSNYVVVIYKYNFYKLPVYAASGKLLHVHSLVDELEDIYSCPLKRGEPFGLLTHDNRGNWAEAYTSLICPSGNGASVQAIEESIFVVCMDEYVPLSKGKEKVLQAHQLLHGGGSRLNSPNRWMDKTIQLIVNPNGLAGFCYEHSPADCQPLGSLMDFVQQKLADPEYGCNCCDADTPVTATWLSFQPLDDCVNLWICEARRKVAKIVSMLQLEVLQFDCHGNSFIKCQGLNPDSYIQMALQLAYYKMHGKLPAQYESAHLRIFQEGRTETIRSTSTESKEFVLSMVSPKATDAERLDSLRKAVDAHEKLTLLALNGGGIDRHLFGLQQMAIENCLPLPEFFRSKGFVQSVTFQLFTSQVATSHEGFMAFGPLITEGYACCYNPHDDKIIFAISAWRASPKISAERYAKAIKKSLEAMRKVILMTGGDRGGENLCSCPTVLIPIKGN
ncbi:hypothetical protein KR009_001927 [Drosophila setifemur]|nr:hypothetical protein KR009_001927 [Drosophila setifemur]